MVEELVNEMNPDKVSSPGTLSELNTQLSHLEAIISQVQELDEITPELQDALVEVLEQREATHEALLNKLDNYCSLIKSLEQWAEVREQEAKRITKLAQQDSNKANQLKQVLFNYLNSNPTFRTKDERVKVKTKRFNLSIRNAGGKQAIGYHVANPAMLPEAYQRIEVTADSQAIREALESGDEQIRDYAYWKERTQYLRIQ